MNYHQHACPAIDPKQHTVREGRVGILKSSQTALPEMPREPNSCLWKVDDSDVTLITRFLNIG